MTVRLGRWDSTSDQGVIHDADVIAGSPSGFTRHYLDLQDNWTGGFTQFSFDRERIPVIAVHSWKADRTPVQWAAVADGTWDTEITTHAQDFADLPGRTVPAYFVFHHEPENEENNRISGDITGTCGTHTEFRAAATHFQDLIRAVMPSFTDCRIGVTLMAGTYTGGHGGLDAWTQGVDCWFYGVDAYNHGSTKETFSAITKPAHDAATVAGKKLFIQEIGCEEIPGTQFKAEFFKDMRTVSKTWPELVGIEYSNVKAKGDYRIDTSPKALAAFKALGQDPYFDGSWT